jgi:hypothetical protein
MDWIWTVLMFYLMDYQRNLYKQVGKLLTRHSRSRAVAFEKWVRCSHGLSRGTVSSAHITPGVL